MPHSARSGRTLRAVAVPPGLAGVSAVMTALVDALAGGPAMAPVPSATPQTPGDYVRRIVAALRPDDPAAPLERDDIVAVVATSGSTGDPRGVLVTEASMRAAVDASLRRLGGAGRWVAAIPVHHVGGLAVLARCAIGGFDPVADPSVGGGASFDPDVFAATTAHARSLCDADGSPLYVSLVPAQVSRLLASPSGAKSLRLFDAVLCGAAATPLALRDQAAAQGVRLVTTYGMSETFGGCVYDGRPLDGVEVTVTASADLARSASAGRATGSPAGQLVIGGPMVALGYRCRPDLTASVFIDSRVRTDDIGTVDPDGLVAVLGRLDQIVTVNGVNVSLSAVESLLLSVPGVRTAAVVAVPDPVRGAALHAVVVPVPGSDRAPRPQAEPRPEAPWESRLPTPGLVSPCPADVARWHHAVLERLGAAAVPRGWHLADEVPLLPTGKVDRAAVALLVSPEESAPPVG